jgi:putative transposase
MPLNNNMIYRFEVITRLHADFGPTGSGRPKASLKLGPEERQELSGFAASRSPAHALVSRAKLVLLVGVVQRGNRRAPRWVQATVGKWRQRFVEHRIQGLYDELRPGRPRSISDEKVASLLHRTLRSKMYSAAAASSLLG